MDPFEAPSAPIPMFAEDEADVIQRFFADRESNYGAYRSNYRKVIYGSRSWQAIDLIEQRLRAPLGDQYLLFGDLYLELAAEDSGFESWHTDLNSLYPLEDPMDMLSAWISLSSPSEETGGGIWLAARDELSGRLAHVSHLRTIDPRLDDFLSWNGERVCAHLDRTGRVYRPARGECLFFHNALFHKTERVVRADFVRKCVILRMVKKPVRIDEGRLAALERRGSAAEWVSRWRELLGPR
jgi:hypothetical protein